MHLLERFGRKKPVVQFNPSHAQRILQVLPHPRAETINRNRKCRNLNFAHENLSHPLIVFNLPSP
jgi:hypothetical protein